MIFVSRQMAVTLMTTIMGSSDGGHFLKVTDQVILHVRKFYHLIEREVTMSPIFESEDGKKIYHAAGGENSQIPAHEGARNTNNLRNLSREANELLMRLNELANGHPFNVIYKAKLNDTR